MSDDDLEDFLALVPNAVPKPQEEKDLGPGDGEDDPLDFLPVEPEPAPKCEDPEAQIARILAKVPDADPTHVTELVSKSSHEFINALLAPMSKRARFVRDALLQKRSLTSFDLKATYSSETRAITDLVQAGIPLHTETVQAPNGRPTTLYTLDPSSFSSQKDGREGIPQRIRDLVLDAALESCSVCRGLYPKRVLQVDHRAPFDLAGNTLARSEGIHAFQALCPSCNTAKAHACKRCPNKDLAVCRSCYWAYPESYKHIATKHERRLTLVANSPEQMDALAKLEAQARSLGLT